MFKVSLADVSLLRDSINTISEIIGEGIFEISKDGISLVAADRAMVAVVDLNLEKDLFEEYKCGEKSEVGINIENLLQILKRAGGSEKLELELPEDGSKLIVRMFGESTREFSLPLLDISRREVPETQDLDFSGSVEIKSSLLKKGINDADVVSDVVIFKGTKESFVMSSGGDSSSTEMEVKKDSEGLKKLESEEEIKSTYPLEYLKKMIKASKISDVVSLKFGSDFPMKIEFSRPEKIRISFILAPRVSED